MSDLIDISLAASMPKEGADAELAGQFVSFPDSPFQLYQPYPPAGDQPTAINLLCEGIEDGLACWG